MMKVPKQLTGLLIFGLVVLLVSGCAGLLLAKDETPGQHFERMMKEFAANCAKARLKPNDTACDILKLKPADPLATEEGRFAHSIKIPNPVPEDSGYKPGMTPEQYFEHLCKTEAGEFIYKTVENVKGFYLMRSRKRATDSEMEHLYALEAPYIEVHGEYYDPGEYFVQPNLGKYEYVEVSLSQPQSENKYKQFYRDEAAHPGRRHQTAIDGRSVFVPYIVAERNTASLTSTYAVTWRATARPHDREFGVAGSELIVLNLATSEVLGVKRGFKRTGGVRNLTGIWWLAGPTCPRLSERPDHWFVKDVLKPTPDSKVKEK